MMKKKLFCCVAVCFFVFNGVVSPVLADVVNKIDEAEIKALAEHNKKQMENRQFLKDYQKKHSDLVDPKADGYWNMAFHARLADYGDVDSQYIIAQAYEKGEYTAVNPQKAVAFYKKAAEKGHIESAMRLAQIYEENKWVQKDEEKAMYYYLKAANNAYAPAQMKVAFLYEANQEYQKAYDWFLKAMKQLFPNEENLQERSPDLKRLAEKVKYQNSIKITDESYEGV